MAECTNKQCDNGYIFDTSHACTECEAGKAIQCKYDINELSRNLLKNKGLRKRIKEYEAN